MNVSKTNNAQSVAFVRDADDLSRLEGRFQETTHFLTSSLSVLETLTSSGRKVHGLWAFLDDAARKEIVLDATRLKDEWYQDLRASFQYRGVNMGEALKFAVYYFLFEALTANRVAELYFRSASPAHVRLPEIMGIPVKYSLHNRSSIPEAVLAFHAQQSGARVEWFPASDIDSSSTAAGVVRNLIPEPLKRIRRRLTNRLASVKSSIHAQELVSLNQAASELQNGSFKAICASCFQNFLLMLPLAEALDRTGRWATLRVHTVASLDYDASLNDPSSADFIREETEKFFYLEMYRLAAMMPPGGKEFRSSLREEFLSWQKDHSGRYEALFRNPYLGFQFDYLLESLMSEACMMVDAATALFDRARPDVLLVGNGSEKDHTLACVAHSRGITRVLIPHNRVWAYPEVYDFPVNYVAVRNKGTAEFLKSVLGPRETIVAGDLKPQRKFTESAQSHTEVTSEKKERQVLILIGWISPGLFQFFDIGAFYSSLKNLLAQVSKHTDWRLVFRSHPRSAALETINDLIRASEGYKIGQVTIELERAAEELVSRADVLILFDYRSSPVIAAWKQGVPVVYFRSSAAFYSTDDMLKEENFLTASSFSGLEQIIERLFEDSEWRREWIDKGKAFADKYFSDPEIPADHFTKLLEEIVRNKRAPVVRERHSKQDAPAAG